MNLIFTGFFVFLVLFSLLASIRCDGDNETENIIASELQVENNEDQRNTTTTEGDIRNELKNLDNETGNVKTEESTEANKNVSLKVLRNLRGAEKRTSNLGMECVSCYGSGISTSDEKCYRGAA